MPALIGVTDQSHKLGEGRIAMNPDKNGFGQNQIRLTKPRTVKPPGLAIDPYGRIESGLGTR